MIQQFCNFSLKYFNSFGIAAQAHSFNVFNSVSSILDADQDLTDGLVLGGGSNMILVSDQIDKVNFVDIKGVSVINEDDDHVVVRAHAGENWHRLVLWALARDYGGIENLSLIPGSVGAAPIQNIGAYGVEIKDTLISVRAIHKSTRTIKEFDNKSCEFGYRDSVFKRTLKDQYIIVSVDLKLSKRNHKTHLSYGAIMEELTSFGVSQDANIKQISQAIINIRQRKLYDPKEVGNCGSFFKNPIVDTDALAYIRTKNSEVKYFEQGSEYYKVPAGWLIDSLGWKGKSHGGAAVSPKHALVLINENQATGKDVWQLSEEIKESVKDEYHVDLEREVNMIF